MTPELQSLFNSYIAFQTIQRLLSVGMYMGEYAENVAKAQHFTTSLVTQAQNLLKEHKDYETYFYPDGQLKPIDQNTVKVTV